MKTASITKRLADLGSDKWSVHLEARRRKLAGEDVIELTIGEPDIAPDPALIEEAARAMRAGRIRYSNGRGEPALLDALSRKYSARTGREIGHDNLMCFPGTQTALFAVMLTLVEKGDTVLVGDPLYATYEGVIRSTGAEIATVPLRARDGFRMQADVLAKAITPETRVLLLNTPHNPTGAVRSADDIAAIGEVCRRHDLWIVADEVYEELIFEGSFTSPLDLAGLADRTIVVSSISKSHAAPGFRSGWAVGPAAFCDELLPVAETMLFGNQPFIADMTALALDSSFETARAMREAYRSRAKLLAERLSSVEGLTPISSQAGMFMLLDVRETGMSGSDFASALLAEEGVALMPGSSFGEEAAGFVRASLTVPEEMLEEAARRIARFVDGDAAEDLRRRA